MTVDRFHLNGKVAIVTGGNTGLGQAMAVALAEAGAAIALVGRSAPDETVARIDDCGPEHASSWRTSGSTEPVERIVQDTGRALGPLGHPVNNAGIIRRADALEFSEADWDASSHQSQVPFFLARAVARRMCDERRRGKIINVASLLSFQGGVNVASYTASKSGLAGLTRLLANEWAAHGINVNAIVPGYIATNITEALRNDPGRNRDILARIPAGRWGEPDDLGGAAVFLASAASDYVHGVMLPVDGGWLAR